MDLQWNRWTRRTYAPAGVIADGKTVARAGEQGLHRRDYLGRNDSYTFFQALDDLVITGPSRTNVMDMYMVLACGR